MLVWQAISVIYLSSSIGNVVRAQYNIQPQSILGLSSSKQRHTVSDSKETIEEDHRPEETSFNEQETLNNFRGNGGGGGIGDNYFMYQHTPHKDHFETGYRRGDDHHYQERHEKAHPHQGKFHAKVTWGDVHGGHGEHHWDYNHHGHHHGEEQENHGEGDDVGNHSHVSEDTDEEAAADKKIFKKPELAQNLAFNMDSGMIIDTITGQKYRLQPLR